MFKRKQQVKEDNADWTDKAAGKIAGAGRRLQGMFAKVMGKLFSKNVRTFFVVFCLSAGGYSLFLIAEALLGNKGTQPVMVIEQATIPKHIDDTDNDIVRPQTLVDDETYLQLREFSRYMDSLKRYEPKVYDSIMITRPGLMDSTRMLIEMHQEQKR